MPKPVVTPENLHEFWQKAYSHQTNAEVEAFFHSHDWDMERLTFTQVNEVKHLYWRNVEIKVMTDTIIEVAGRYHFILLTKLVLEHMAKGTERTDDEVRQTFRQYEAKFKQIEKGEVTDEEILYLQSLPYCRDWNDHEFTLEQMNEFYFKDQL